MDEELAKEVALLLADLADLRIQVNGLKQHPDNRFCVEGVIEKFAKVEDYDRWLNVIARDEVLFWAYLDEREKRI